MKKCGLLILLFLALSVSAGAQSKKMMQLKDICLELRNNIGSEHVISQSTIKLKRFHGENVFHFGLDKMNGRIVKGHDNLVSVDGHILFVPEYFDDLLKNGNMFLKLEELVKELEQMEKPSRGLGYAFCQHNFAIKKNSSITFEMEVTSNIIDIMAIAEPNATITMNIYDMTAQKYYNDTDADKRGKECVHKSINLAERTKLQITIYNRSAKDAAVALFSF
jgi:hypothetical protein